MAEDKHFMNKAHGAHMGHPSGGKEGEGKGAERHDMNEHHPPHMHIHSHSGGHTVHIMHHDGHHEKFEHQHGDAAGMAEHVHRNFAGPSDDSGLDTEQTGLEGLGL